MGSHSEQEHAKVKACAWEDLSGSNGENGLGAVRLEACCNDPMSHHETPELESAATLERQFTRGGIPKEEWGQSRMIPR